MPPVNRRYIFMHEILKEYGPALLTVVAIIALLILITALIGSDKGSVVGAAFTKLLDSFFTQASDLANLSPGTLPAGD